MRSTATCRPTTHYTRVHYITLYPARPVIKLIKCTYVHAYLYRYKTKMVTSLNVAKLVIDIHMHDVNLLQMPDLLQIYG